jgi:dTDP-4-amino-4,6-dideoxygalactose transaminase
VKRSLDDLALFGGAPLFSEPIHVGRPNIGNRENLLRRLSSALDTRWLSNGGPLVQEFEEKIAAQVGVRHCVVTSSATRGIEILARALKIAGRVIVPSFTFVATANALRWVGLEPVFCDVDPNTHNLDPASVEELLDESIGAIMGVHLWGRACDVDALTELARRAGCPLIFDAAHAFGCGYKGRPVGGFGNAEVFSFHATKCVNSFEGGAIVTNDEKIASEARLLQSFGFADFDYVTRVGINGRMSEASAAMGLTSLDSMEEFIAINRQNYAAYREGLSGITGLDLIEFGDTFSSNYHYIIVQVDEGKTAIGRDMLHRVLWSENILARRYFYPGCHHMTPYKDTMGRRELPVTDHLASSLLSLPSGGDLRPAAIVELCRMLKFIVANAADIVARTNSQVQVDKQCR